MSAVGAMRPFCLGTFYTSITNKKEARMSNNELLTTNITIIFLESVCYTYYLYTVLVFTLYYQVLYLQCRDNGIS